LQLSYCGGFLIWNHIMFKANSPTIPPSDGDAVIQRRKRTKSARRGISLDSPQIVKRLAEMPKNYRNLYRTAKKGNNLRAALNSFCLECAQWQREEVMKCGAIACPLYGYRPYQNQE